MDKKEIIPIKKFFDQDEIKRKFEEMLGKKSTGFMVSVINIINNNDKLVNADRNSILFAAATAATLDLPINENLGFAYIVPYNGKRKVQENGKDKWIYETKAQFQMGYKGFIQLAQRTGQFKTISATPIFEGQLISENPLTGYEFDFTKKESDKIIGYAGYFSLINGFEKTSYMTIEELKAHGKKYSQSYKKNYGLWEDNFDSMATKTVLKLLLSKFAPMTVQMQTALLADQSTNEDEYPDNRPPSLDEVQKEKEENRIREHIQGSINMVQLEEAEAYIWDLTEDHELTILYETKKNELSKLESAQ